MSKTEFSELSNHIVEHFPVTRNSFTLFNQIENSVLTLSNKITGFVSYNWIHELLHYREGQLYMLPLAYTYIPLPLKTSFHHVQKSRNFFK